jgi:hypothetical protein
MATTNDIDTKSAVRKFLEQRTVVDNEDAAADSSDEVQAILESVALSFLLYPQTALSFLIIAKNTLQQLASDDLDLVNFMQKTLDEINNPDDPITDSSDIIEAQTALVEIDRLGKVNSDSLAFSRYNSAVNRFLDNVLAKTLKRRRRGEFERTGDEARQDLFQILSLFKDSHSLVISKLSLLLNGINNFRSVDLTRIVSSRVITKVRSSLKKVLRGVETSQLSKTSVALEMLSGAAALSSVSDIKDIYDPTIETNIQPNNRKITFSAELVGAVAQGTSSDTDLTGVSTPWIFDITVNPQLSGPNYSVTLPVAGASNRHYVKAKTGASTFNIPSNKKTLYVQFDGITPPVDQAVLIRTIVLTSGSSVPLSTILSDLNNVTTGLINGTAVELAPGTGRIVIYGSSSVTGITILDQGQGSFDILGNFIPAAASAHDILGFSGQQRSGPPSVFSINEFVDILSANVSTAAFRADSGTIIITSNSTDSNSSLSFGSGVASKFGFLTSEVYEAQPSYIELFENGLSLDPSDLGVFVGSVVTATDILSETARSLFSPILSIDGTKIKFDQSISLPRGLNRNIKIQSPLVFKIQSLINSVSKYKSVFNSDFNDLQQVLTPVLSNPTLSQINDAKLVLSKIGDNIQGLLTSLQSIVVRSDQTEFQAVANRITSALQERGLDRSLALLELGQFAEFFSLTGENASKSSRFLKATEEVGKNELLKTTIEQDVPAANAKATTPDNKIVTGQELMEDEDQI